MAKIDLFTEEAKQAITTETQSLSEELIEEATNEALAARGEPIEVTASDVRRARARIVRVQQSPKLSSNFLWQIYAVMGGLIALGGLIYPTVRPILESSDPVTRSSLLISLMGATMALFSLGVLYFFRLRYAALSRKKLEDYKLERFGKTVQNEPCFELRKTSDGKFFFNLKAANGEIILGSESYKSKSAALNGIDFVKQNALVDDRYERKVASNRQSFFVLHATNKEPIGHSEMYSSRLAMAHGIASVKSNAPIATVTDLTS